MSGKEIVWAAERRAALLRDLPNITPGMFDRTLMVIHCDPHVAALPPT